MKRLYRELNTFYGQVIAITIINLLILPFLPWWSFIIPGILFGRFYPGWGGSFSAAGLGCTLPWAIMIFFRYQTGGELIIRRVSEMMGLPSPWLLTIVTLLIPFILGGLAGVSGFMIFSRKTNKDNIDTQLE